MDAADPRKETLAMPALYDGSPEADPLEAPGRPDELACHYDLAVACPDSHPESHTAFDRWLAEAAASYGLSCARLTSAVAAGAIDRLASGELSVGLHIACSTDWLADDVFARLAFAVQDSGGHPVNSPARARAFTDRTATHHELIRRGLGVLPSVVVRPWADDPFIADHQRWQLRLDEPGTSIEVVPAGRGEVVRVEKATAERVRAVLAQARQRRAEALLVRPEVRPPWLTCSDGQYRPAYWRVVSCLGEVTAFWWQPAFALRRGQPAYHEVTPEEVRNHALAPIYQYVQALADLSGLEWFSAELTLCADSRPGAFTIADVDGLDLPLVQNVLDDGSELDVRSRCLSAPPDEFVRRLAWRLAELAWQVRQRTQPAERILRLRAG
jgi:hypothetical protein